MKVMILKVGILPLVALAMMSGVVGFSSQAEAAVEGEPAMWIGGAYRLFVPNKSSTTARPMYGATMGAKIGTELGLGAYYFSSQKDEGATVGKFNLDFYGVEGTYHFEGEAKGAYFGVRLGITKMNYGVTEVTASPFHAGIIGGYNHWLTNNISLGGDVSFYSVSKGEATPPGGTPVSVESFSALSFLATLKLWL